MFKNSFKMFYQGLEHWHRLTTRKEYKLRIDLESSTKGKCYSEYQHFKIDSKENFYAIQFDDYSGNCGKIAFVF